MTRKELHQICFEHFVNNICAVIEEATEEGIWRRMTEERGFTFPEIPYFHPNCKASIEYEL